MFPSSIPLKIVNSNTSITHTFWITNKDSHRFVFYLHELRCICLLYYGIVVNNNILTTQQQFNFNKYLLQHFNNNGQDYAQLSWRLLYRSDCKIYDSNIMRNHCNNKRNLLILVKAATGNVCGGYSSLGRVDLEKDLCWKIRETLELTTSSHKRMLKRTLSDDVYDRRQCGFCEDKNAFLFRCCDEYGIYSPKIFPLKQNQHQYAIYQTIKDTESVFFFGDFDLNIYHKSIVLCFMLFSEPVNYQLEANELSAPDTSLGTLLEIYRMDPTPNSYLRCCLDYCWSNIIGYIHSYDIWILLFSAFLISHIQCLCRYEFYWSIISICCGVYIGWYIF